MKIKSVALPATVCLRFGLILASWSSTVIAASNHTTPYTLVPFAGVSSIGSADGQGQAARFQYPLGIATDRAGNIYVADSGNETIRKITPTGLVSTLAGTAGLRGDPAGVDGTGTAVQFSGLTNLVVDPAGNIYVSDSYGHAIRKVTASGVVSTFVNRSSSFDPLSSPIYCPWGLALDAAGTLYYADFATDTVQKVTAAGIVSKVAGQDDISGYADGSGSNAQFFYPEGITADKSGNLYVGQNNFIRRISASGEVTTLPTSPGITDTDVAGLAVDASGNLIVAATHSSVIAKIPVSGPATIIAGSMGKSGYQDGPATTALFDNPKGVAIDPTGNIFVVDLNNVVRKITPAGQVSTLAGLPVPQAVGSADGTGDAARFSGQCRVATLPNGDLVVSDYSNRTIRKITSSGVVTTIAGAVGDSRSVDGPADSARFAGPNQITTDSAGNIFVFDLGNIRKITPNGTVSTIAKSADLFFAPLALVADATGNLFAAGDHDIRRISPSGVITDYAGGRITQLYGDPQPGSNDGTGSAARFNTPNGLALDRDGNLFVADGYNHVVRKITPEKVVTTFAGIAGIAGSDDGRGDAARFNFPHGLAMDDAGNLFVAEAGNSVIRMITPDGTVSTPAGLTYARSNAPGTDTEVRLNSPESIAVDHAGNLYVPNFSMIYKGLRSSAPLLTEQPQSQIVSPGNNVQLSATAKGTPAPTYQWFFNGSPFANATEATLTFTNARSTDAGDYTVVATNVLGKATSNKATLTISNPSTPSPTTTNSSAGASGGGGSIEAWFAVALLALTATRLRSLSRQTLSLSIGRARVSQR